MAVASSSKGKKRANEETRSSSSSLSPVPEELPKPKRSRRLEETRKCPVCDEVIPLRLLAKHSELETRRVEQVIQQVGSPDILFDDPHDGPGPSSRSRRSALKARKSLSAMNGGGNNSSDILQKAGKAIQAIQKHRKRRYARFRDMAREEVEGGGKDGRRRSGDEIVCPVCLLTVRGDQDVLDAHVDACLANESRRLDEERMRAQQQQRAEEWEEPDIGDGAGGHVGDVRGTGFHTRNQHEEDVDDELDVDGDEGFGEPQFTEGDILPVDISRPAVEEDVEVEIEGDGGDEAHREQKTLRDLVTEGKVVRSSIGVDAVKAKMEEVMGVGDADKMDLAILAARKRDDKSSLITALENKVKQLETMHVSSSTSLLCRICIDPYTEPTVSTGCWHTCCRECWLRCLGSTKLCPICKRITGAADLRRIYL
ncbi:hypothetical protein Hypma_012810 [Hypsizygus marmoreus]|uniref:RING-type domain-containing protein n=1 Tax=Hypsizygus marmoreus TaxID=39966 RepID=A0A369JM16_HYPMA|nr:hypothetical protein Hypma_012810 [Hypsizygus marmoreus]